MIGFSRREVMKSLVFLTGAAGEQLRARGTQSTYAYVGCFTTSERQGHGDGIHVFRMDPQTGSWVHIQRVGSLTNPSFLILSRDRRSLYSVHGDENYVSSFAIDGKTKYLTPLNRVSAGGSNGVHLATDASGKFLLIANYSTGTVGTFRLQSDGKIEDRVQLTELPAPAGLNARTSSHPHQIVFDPSGHFVLVPDKGLDRVFVFQFDSISGKLTLAESSSIGAPSLSTPRHLRFHPSLPIIWVLNESASTVTSCQWDSERGSLKPFQTLRTLPPDFTGHSTAAEIAVLSNGRFIYSSNRGHDSVSIFSSDPKTGLLKTIGSVATEGIGPRFISLDPSHRFLYAANEVGGSVLTYHVDQETGHLTPTGQKISTPSPVCIAFLT